MPSDPSITSCSGSDINPQFAKIEPKRRVRCRLKSFERRSSVPRVIISTCTKRVKTTASSSDFITAASNLRISDFIITQGVAIISAISVQQAAPASVMIPVFAAIKPTAIISIKTETWVKTVMNIYLLPRQISKMRVFPPRCA